jgi:hypothetical protein
MQALDTATELTRFGRRGAGTDAERRAAVWLAGQVRGGRRRATLQTFWCRPNWALAQAWHTLAAIVGSLLEVHHSILGGAIVLAALLCVVADGLTGYSPGRRLTLEHASQNVVSRASAPPGPTGGEPPRVRLVVTANYDAGRTGLAYRTWLRAPAARLRRIAGALSLGWAGCLALTMVWLLVVAFLRHQGATGTPIGVVQLIPTAGLVLALALLLELAAAPFGPAASDNAAGTAVAMSLVRALDAAPPPRLEVELVLQGAGEAGMVGLRRHLRSRRGELRPATTIVLGIAAAGRGRPSWWSSDGPLLPLRPFVRLRRLAAQTLNATGTGTGAGTARRPHRGRGTSPAWPARARRLPALTIGCLDTRGLAPRSHQPGDIPEALDPAALDALLQFALTLVDAIDADLARVTNRRAGATPAVA